MAYRDPALMHLDKALTGISVAYTNDEFIAEELYPSVTVTAKTAKYNVFERTGFTVLDDIRAKKGRAAELPPHEISRDSYTTEEHALVDVVAPEDVEEADPGTLASDFADSTRELTDTILLNRENLAQTQARTAANYATNHTVTLSGTDQWDDYTNSDPVGDMKTARDQVRSAIMRKPNLAIIPYAPMAKLEDHTKIIDRIKYTVTEARTSEKIIANWLGVNRIVIPGAVKNTANVGQPLTLADMWGNDVILAYVPERPGKRTPAFGYEFTYPFKEALIPGMRGGAVMPTERWWDVDHKAWKIRVSRRYDHKIIAVDAVATGKAVAGYLIKDAI